MFRVEHNIQTNEIKKIPLTDKEIEEIKNYEKKAKEKEAIIQAEAEAKAQAKAEAEAKLAKLGLTADDLRALGL